MTLDTVEDGGWQGSGESKRVGQRDPLAAERVCVRGILEQGEGNGRGNGGAARGGQQPVLDDHSTHYTTDAAADPVEKEDPLLFSRYDMARSSSEVLTPLLPARLDWSGAAPRGNQRN